MQIRSENDLKLAYETINSFKEMMPMAQKTDVALEYIKELKRDIRGFFRKEKEKPQRRLVKDDGTVACTSAKSHRTQRSSWQSEDTMKWQ